MHGKNPENAMGEGGYMKKSMWLLGCGIAAALALAVGIWAYYHPTHYRFNDRVILGRTEEEIVERYGVFSKSQRSETGEILYGTYMIRDNTPELIMGYDNSLWYEVYFKDGVAAEVRLQEGWYGG